MALSRSSMPALVCVFAFGCDGLMPNAHVQSVEAREGEDKALDRSDLPLRAATEAQRQLFARGDMLFEAVMRPADGLGPLFIKSSCASCHRDDGRGPGLVGKLGYDDALLAADGRLGDSSAAVAKRGQGPLRFGATIRPMAVGGATPAASEAYPIGVRSSYRLPPAVFGRGYLEAIADAEIERVESLARKRTGAIRGRIHRVAYQSQPNAAQTFHAHQPGERNLIGRFGLKARLATLDEFAADALQGDMGLTSPLRPSELPNADGRTDDAKPGVDMDIARVNDLADYTRLVDIPQRRAASAEGRALFDAADCGLCHVPQLRTRADYPIAQLANIDAPVFTDLLIHDMGASLSDGVPEGDATAREWRTAPLIGLRFYPAFMHDGRAKSINEAISAHAGPGSEANESVEKYLALTQAQQQALVAYVHGL